MSCFTLGTSYRRKKTNSTTEYVENKADLLISHPNDGSGPLNFVTEQSNVKESVEISNSVSCVSNEVACCSSPTPTLEKIAVRYKKRRKKKRAPLPPCSPISTTNSFSSVTSQSTNKVDDLPGAIGKLYVFNKAGYQNKQKERKPPQNISILCKGRYARVIEEKPLKNDVRFEQTVSSNNLAIEKQKSTKRKSAKKRRAPQPPQVVPVTKNVSTRQSEQNRINGVLCNGLNSCHINDRMCFSDINLSATHIQPLSPIQFSNLDPEFFKCNCVTCKRDNNTAVFLPHVICPSLPKNAESSNITILGYCNVDQIGRTVVIQNNNALLQPNNSNVNIPTPNTASFAHCSRCTPSSDIERNCYANGDSSRDSADSGEEEYDYRYYSMPLNRKNRLCSYQCERSDIDYVSQRMVERKRNCNNYYLDKREISRRHHYSNTSQNEGSYKKTSLSHLSTTNFCSCSDKQWMSDENSDEFSENSDGCLLWEREASNIAYSSEMNVVLPRRKIKSTHRVSEFKPHKHSEDEFDGFQDLIKSRPSVKDFIAAFNYLTQKTNSDFDISPNNDKLHHQSTYSNNKLTIEETDMENNFDLKSLPTKWRYSPVNAIADEKSLLEKEPDVNLSDNLALPKCNKNKRVTFKKGTKSETKPSANVHVSKHHLSSFKNANSKYKMSQDARFDPPSTSIADVINMPCTHTISMAYKHASNQQLANARSRQHTSQQSCYLPNRKVMHNGNSPKEIKSLINTDQPSLRSNQSAKHLGYRKAYRAPPVPDHPVFLQNAAKSAQNKAKSCKISERKSEIKDYPKEHSTDRNQNIEDKIWVSLYIEDKSSHKGLIPLLLSPTMTVRMLKIKLEKQFGYARDLQRWILGKSFATDDNATLASYNVTEAGCPIFLYMTTKNLPNDYEALSIAKTTDQNQDTSTEESDSDITDSDSGTVILASDTEQESSESSGTKPAGCHSPGRKKNVSILSNLQNNKMEEPQKKYDFRTTRREQIIRQLITGGGLPSTEKSSIIPPCLKRHYNTRYVRSANNSSQSNDSTNAIKTSEVMRENYKRWVEIVEKDLISNLEPFECPVCFLDVPANEGIMLKDCLHLFCRECLSNAVYYAEEAVIKCPFRNDEYSCDSHLQEREIKALVSPEVYERHLQRSIAAAESQAKNSFHCKSPDCPGWCLYEDKVNLFLCPVCGHLNCLTCQAIHEGRNCRQYQDELEFNSTTSDEAKKTKDYLDNMLKEGEAMRCPQCHIVLMKKWGCDWLKCSVCLTEVCWVTKGRRWGPAGRGDTSGGCRCGLNGVRCHPKCNYCH